MDFTTFAITGPSSAILTDTGAEALGGALDPAGKKVSQRTTCATDTFSIANAPNVPVLCGTLTGEHGTVDFIYTI